MRGSAVSMPSTSVQIWISAGAQTRADDRRRVVGAAAAERGRHALAGGADEAADHRNAARRERRIDVSHQRRGGFGKLRRRRRCSPSVTTARRASTQVAGSPCGVRAAATMRLLRISPVAAMASSQRGDTSRRTPSACDDALELVELAVQELDHLLALHRDRR